MTFPDKLAFHEHKITVKIRSHEVMRSSSYSGHRDPRTAGFTIYFYRGVPHSSVSFGYCLNVGPPYRIYTPLLQKSSLHLLHAKLYKEAITKENQAKNLMLSVTESTNRSNIIDTTLYRLHFFLNYLKVFNNENFSNFHQIFCNC